MRSKETSHVDSGAPIETNATSSSMVLPAVDIPVAYEPIGVTEDWELRAKLVHTRVMARLQISARSHLGSACIDHLHCRVNETRSNPHKHTLVFNLLSGSIVNPSYSLQTYFWGVYCVLQEVMTEHIWSFARKNRNVCRSCGLLTNIISHGPGGEINCPYKELMPQALFMIFHFSYMAHYIAHPPEVGMLRDVVPNNRTYLLTCADLWPGFQICMGMKDLYSNFKLCDEKKGVRAYINHMLTKLDTTFPTPRILWELLPVIDLLVAQPEYQVRLDNPQSHASTGKYQTSSKKKNKSILDFFQKAA